jgi:hypothetical protein
MTSPRAESALIPFAELSPTNSGKLAQRAWELMETLENWGLRLESSASLLTSVRQLERVAERDSYGNSLPELQRTGEALRIVYDWLQVLNCLTDKRASNVAEELCQAIASGANDRRASDILSQFWFGTLLAHSGLRPAVPPAAQGRRPDFVIQADTYLLSVEVKRPQTLSSTLRAVREAAAQIRDYGKPGFVALDLSLALNTQRFLIGGYLDSEQPLERFGPDFLQATEAIAARVRGQRSEGSYRSLMGLFMFARGDAWHHQRMSSPYSTVFVNSRTFERACFGLVTNTSERVTGLIRSGVERLTGAPVRGL